MRTRESMLTMSNRQLQSPIEHKESRNLGERANILMVDDEPAKLLSYEVILGELGENLIKAKSAREALDLLLKHDVAVVLMDVSMPEIDGFELADMIRQHPRFQKTAIIFISAVHLTDLDRVRGYQRGAVDYISVPIIPELLRAKVSVFAELHRKTRELEKLNRELESRVEERTEQLGQSENQVRHLNTQLEQRLAELETIMQVLPVGVAVAQDPACRTMTGNAAFSELLGVKQGEVLSLSVNGSGAASYRFYRNGRRLVSDELPVQRSAATRRPVRSTELELHRDDGSIKYLIASASPLFDLSGEVRGAVGAFFDVTSRRHLEDLLRERADLLELASEAILVRDQDGILQFWNSGAEALYGWKREEVLGAPVHEVLRTQFPVALSEIESGLADSGRWNGNLVQCTKDGREVVVASRQAVKREGRSILEINRDITSQLRAEDALRKAERLAAMGRVAGIIAHEINNPLDAITNAFYLLRDHPSLDEDAKRVAAMGEQELLRLSHITRQTLGFYRESQYPVAVSIIELLDDILELQARRLQINRITLDKQYHSSGMIQGFPVELKQVFLNLIANAIQAMPQGGRLRLRVSEQHPRKSQRPRVSISISDTGTGIHPDHAKHLFEPFFSTKEAKGTGLGLWISMGIVQKYEGTIRFRSIPLTGGSVTCFRVVMPMAETEVNGSNR